MASQAKDIAWLDWISGLMGMTSRQTENATLSPSQFHCLLDELPLHLIPKQGLEESEKHLRLDESLFLNPQCLILPPTELPEEFRTRRHLLENFCMSRTVAWVRDSATAALQPFWLGPRLEAIVSRMRPGQELHESIPLDARRLLVYAGILLQKSQAQRQRTEWSDSAAMAAVEFREKEYTTIRGLVHPFHIAALRRYYRCAIRRGAIRLGDDQSSRRYVSHNEGVARFFHHQIAGAVSKIVGEAVKPSYVYFASYLGGAELKKHTDREQCEFSVTLCLDFTPEPELATSWPIRVDTPSGSVAVYQALGDGLIYRGTKVPHFRTILDEGHTSTSIFFHYVPADFKGRLD